MRRDEDLPTFAEFKNVRMSRSGSGIRTGGTGRILSKGVPGCQPGIWGHPGYHFGNRMDTPF